MFGVESVQKRVQFWTRLVNVGHILCLLNLPTNGIRYESCRENRQEYSRKSVSVVGMDTPNRKLTPRGTVTSEISTLRNGENQWRFDGAITSELFEVLIVMRSDHLLHHEGIG